MYEETEAKENWELSDRDEVAPAKPALKPIKSATTPMEGGLTGNIIDETAIIPQGKQPYQTNETLLSSKYYPRIQECYTSFFLVLACALNGKLYVSVVSVEMLLENVNIPFFWHAIESPTYLFHKWDVIEAYSSTCIMAYLTLYAFTEEPIEQPKTQW